MIYLPDGYTTRLGCFGCRPRWMGAPRTVVGCGGSCRPVWGWCGGGWASGRRRVGVVGESIQKSTLTDGGVRQIGRRGGRHDPVCDIIVDGVSRWVRAECCWAGSGSLDHRESKFVCKRRVVRVYVMMMHHAKTGPSDGFNRDKDTGPRSGWPNHGILHPTQWMGTRRRSSQRWPGWRVTALSSPNRRRRAMLRFVVEFLDRSRKAPCDLPATTAAPCGRRGQRRVWPAGTQPQTTLGLAGAPRIGLGCV